MPRNWGQSSTKPKRRRKKEPTPRARGPQGLGTSTSSPQRKGYTPPPVRTPPSPSGDRPSTRKRDFQRAETFKQTPQYRSDVRDAYTGGTETRPGVYRNPRSAADRSKTIARILHKVTEGGGRAKPMHISPAKLAKLPYEERIILKAHIDRVSRNEVLKSGRARSSIFTDTQRGQVRHYESALRRSIDKTLSEENAERVTRDERARAERENAPRVLPGTRKGQALQQAGMAGAKSEGPDTATPAIKAKEKATERIATAAFAAGASTEEVSKALMDLQTRHKALGLKILEQFLRPISGVAGGVKALAKTGDPVEGVKGMGKGLVSNKESFSKIIAGKDKKASGVEQAAGLALDIFLDPTTYLTLGIGKPALEVARKAAVEAAQQAAVRGLGHAAIQRAAREAAEAAFAAEKLTGKGVKVGFRGTPVRLASIARNLPTTKALPQGERAAKAMEARAAGGRLSGISSRVATSRLGQAAQRSTREVSTSGRGTSRLVGTPLRGITERGAARHAARGGVKKGWRDHLDEILQAVNHSHRPKEFSEVEWDMMTAGAREYRAGMGIAERMGERRLQAYRSYLDEHEVPTESHVKIIDAIEANDLSKLDEPERVAAEQMTRDFEEFMGAEVAAGVRNPDEMIRERTVDVPDMPDTTASRKKVKKAQRAADRAEREVRQAELALHMAQGEAQAVSRSVSDVAGMRAAEKAHNAYQRAMGRVGSTGRPADVLSHIDDVMADGQYAAGKMGVDQARLRLADAEIARAEALEDLSALRNAHNVKVKLAEEARAARRRAAQLEKEAKGYVPRYERTDLGRRGVPHYRDEPVRGQDPGGRTISSTSTKRRTEREPLADLPDEKRAAVVQDIPQIMGERTAESYRLREVAKFNDNAAAMARPVASADDLDIAVGPTGLPDPYDMQRFYIRTRRGELKPAYRVIDRTEQLEDRLRRMIDEGEEVLEVPRATLEAMWDLARRGRTPGRRNAEKMGMIWDEATRKWKWIATQPNPGYHARNLMGDLWNARLGGATLRDVSGALRMLKGARHEMDALSRDMLMGAMHEIDPAMLSRGGVKKFYKGLGGQVSDADIVLLAERLGVVRMGFAGAELRSLRQGNEIRKQTRAGRGLQAFNESREDLMRLASFTRALRRGESPEMAARHANKFHFDYSDLTPAEQQIRRFVPFYTFMARNTPLQLAMLVQSPGRFASFEKVRDASAKAAGIDPDWLEKMPEYLQAQLPFVVPRGEGIPEKVGPLPVSGSLGLPLLASPMLPVTDIGTLDVTGGLDSQFAARVTQSITPFIKLPAEIWGKYDTFYRDKVRKDMVPAPAWASKDNPMYGPMVGNWMKLLGALPGVGEPKIGEVYDRRAGKMVPAWPWWVDKLARSTPITGVVAGVATEGRDKRPGDRALTVSNWLTGVRRQAIDPVEARTSSLFDELEELEEDTTNLKAGRPAPKGGWGGRIGRQQDRISEIQKELNKATGDFATPYFERGGGRTSTQPKNAYGGSSRKRNRYSGGARKTNKYG